MAAVIGTGARLLATDLDGTIIRSNGTISARTLAALARAEAAGMRVVLATGRAPGEMGGVARVFGRRGVAVCSNGACAFDMRTGAGRAMRVIPPGDLAAAAAALRDAAPGIGLAVERAGLRVADRVYPHPAVPRAGDAELFSLPATRLLARHPGYGCDDLLALAAQAAGALTWTHSGAPGTVEAGPPGTSKATAVAGLAATLGIPRQAVIAFGDMPNDLPLMSWAGVSCAVAGAHPAVLAAATRVIGSCDDDGVAECLETLLDAIMRA